MKECSVCFVILHYQDIPVTKKSVEYLSTLDKGGFTVNVIVVDNNSPNKSGLVLKKEYSEDENIHVVINTRNLGFAKGNNVGYDFAKNKFSPNYICVMNNDVYIEQKNFLLELSNSDDGVSHIICPDIVNLNGVHQNPLRKEIVSTSTIIVRFVTYILVYFLSYFKKSVNNSRSISNYYSLNKIEKFGTHNTFIPHGACIIFTLNWIQKEDWAFFPKTFMYGEENILWEYVLSKKYSLIYNQILKVKHLEDVSTNSVISSSAKKVRFQSLNSLRSNYYLFLLRIKRLML